MKAKIVLLIGIIILFFMTLFDYLLHLAELLGVYDQYFDWFRISDRMDYTIFWTSYWGISFLVSAFLLVVCVYTILRSRKSRQNL